MTQKQFCASEGLKFTTFKNWFSRLKKRECALPDGQKGTFEPLTICSDDFITEIPLKNLDDGELSPPALELRLSGASSIVVPFGFHEATLKRLIQVVRGLDV